MTGKPDEHEAWLFGYGSLIYKVDFPYLERRPARIQHWARRFWQGSHDHRGTPEAPGRVATLIPRPGARCGGMAYRVSAGVFAHLDHREKNGYARHAVELELDDGTAKEGLVYIAEQGNPAFLGSAAENEIAAHIARSEGPSGRNADYLLELARALRALSFDDPHVFALERALIALEKEG